MKSNGDVVADMDDELFSLPEITIEGVPERVAERLSKGQRIQYSGSVSGCATNGTTIFLTVSSYGIR